MNNIRTIRESKKISRAKLAEELKVTPGAISQWENFNTMPTAERLIEISKILDCSVDDLLRKEDFDNARQAIGD